jgi:6-pyruvoyl-tetrahydropterin synthase
MEEYTPREILEKYVSKGPFKARELTKQETHKNSSELKNSAWAAGDEMLNEISRNFYEISQDDTKLKMSFNQFINFTALLAELLRTFQITFILAEEGYYRTAFANLRDLLELVMKIRYFYDHPEEFDKWRSDPNKLYTTENIRKLFFRRTSLEKELEKFSQALSRSRHGSSATLDASGPLMTNVSYYRKDLFEKWCKHMIILKDLTTKICKFESN